MYENPAVYTHHLYHELALKFTQVYTKVTFFVEKKCFRITAQQDSQGGV